MNDLVCQHLIRAKDRMKKQSDKNRSERVFQVGDWVFLKVQPYVQSSLAARVSWWANPQPGGVVHPPKPRG